MLVPEVEGYSFHKAQVQSVLGILDHWLVIYTQTNISSFAWTTQNPYGILTI